MTRGIEALRARLLDRLDVLAAELRELLAGELDANPMQPGELARDGDPATVREVLDTLDAGRELVADGMAGDIAAAVAVLVEPNAQAAVLAGPLADRWPWRRGWDLDPHVPDACLYRLLRLVAIKVAPGKLSAADLGRWPDPHLSHADVAQWAREPLNRLHPGKPADYHKALRLRGFSWTPDPGDPDLPPTMEQMRESGSLAARGPGDPIASPEAFAVEYPGSPALGDRLVAEVAESGYIRSVLALKRADGGTARIGHEALVLLCLAVRPDLADAAAWRSVRSWKTPLSGDVHNAAATAALKGSEFANDQAALQLLVTALHDACPGLVAAVAPNADPATVEAVRCREGLLALDADLANWLAGLDPAGNGADKLRDKGTERLAAYHANELDALGLFKLWSAGAAGALELAAWTLWRVRVADQWKRKRIAPPALVRAVAADVLIPAMTRQVVLPGLDDGAIRDKQGHVLGKIALTDGATLDAVRRGLGLLGTVPGHRLIRFLVHRVHDQVEAGGDPYALRVQLDGGWSALAEALCYTHNNNEVLKQLLQAGQHVEWTHPAVKIGGLWTYTATRGGPGRPGMVRITVGEVLAPGLARQLSQTGNTSRQATVAKWLVPELRTEPPVLAVPSDDQGAAWTLHRLVVGELVDRAEELAKTGSVAIGAERWRELQRQARLPGNMLRLRDSWRTGESDKAPALLIEAEPGRFTLADPHALERDFIANGGRKRTEGREAGRKGKANKGKV